MAEGIPPEAREYARSVFAELAKKYTQRELAAMLGLHQSRISNALNRGRVSPEALRKAAHMAGRDQAEVTRALMVVVESLDGKIIRGRRPDDRHVFRDFKNTRGLKAKVAAVAPPGTDERDAWLAAEALARWELAALGPEAVREVLVTLARLRGRLEWLREIDRLKWALDSLRAGGATPSAPVAPAAPDEDR